MATGLHMELVDREAIPEAVWVSAADAPPGCWERHWHNPRPVTPLYADFEFGSHLALSEIVAAEAFAAVCQRGAPARPRRLYLVIDGFAYRGEPAPGFEWGWLADGLHAPPPPQVEVEIEADYEWQVLRRWQESIRAAVIAAVRRFGAVNLASLQDVALRQHIRALSFHLVENWALYFTVDAAAYVVRQRCQAFFTQQFTLAERHFLHLFAGSSPTTSEPSMRMEELARAVLATPLLLAELQTTEPWRQPGIHAVLAVYLEAFGHRTSEWEYIGPTLAERPGRVVELLRETVARVAAGQPSVVEAARQRRDTTVDGLRRQLPNASLRARFDCLLRDAQETFAIHEENINLYMTGSGYLRYALLEAGARLTQQGLLSGADRVFFLRRTELECALHGNPPHDVWGRAERRWSEYQQQLGLDPPHTIAVADSGEKRPVPRPRQVRDVQHAGQLLRGLGASPGSYTGRVRVIVGEDQFEQVQIGEVLVCPQTSPTWTILFGRIGALVTDDGGILSHPAIAAREFGLPAVVATNTATRVLRTGQTVEVDGSGGTVRIVDA